MNTLLNALYELLSFITEDAQAWKLGHVPPAILNQMNKLCNDLGDYLDKNDKV